MMDQMKKFSFRSGTGIGPGGAYFMVMLPIYLLAWATWSPLVFIGVVGWIPLYFRLLARCLVVDTVAKELRVKNLLFTRSIPFDEIQGVEWQSRYFWFVLKVTTVGGDVRCGGITKARKRSRLLRLSDVGPQVQELHETLVVAGVRGVNLKD